MSEVVPSRKAQGTGSVRKVSNDDKRARVAKEKKEKKDNLELEKKLKEEEDAKIVQGLVEEAAKEEEVSEEELDDSISKLLEKCPCGTSIPQTTAKVDCSRCKQVWHAECLQIPGTTEELVSTWVDYLCPYCFVEQWGARPGAGEQAVVENAEGELDRPVTLRELQEELAAFRGQVKVDALVDEGKTVSSGDVKVLDSRMCGTLKTIIKDELHAINPVLITTVKDAVKGALETNVKGLFVEQKKSWADMAKGLNDTVARKTALDKDMVAEVFKAEGGQMLKKTEENLNYEQYERQNRKKNIVVRRLPECDSLDPQKRYKHDLGWLTGTARIEEADIVRCFRPGKRSNERTRPLVCVLKTEELVREHTNDGKGQKIEDEDVDDKDAVYINIDLSPADQLTDFHARQERKARRKRYLEQQEKGQFAS